MNPVFYILGVDAAGNTTGPVGKKAWDDREEAEKHAVEVLKSQINSHRLFVVEVRSCIQRSSPPIEVLRMEADLASVRQAA